MITDVFLDQKRVNVCEHTVNMAPHARSEDSKCVEHIARTAPRAHDTIFTVFSHIFTLF